MLPPAGIDAFPPGVPHSVPAYHRARWPLAVARWWRTAFAHHALPPAAETARPRDAAAAGVDAPARRDDDGV